MEPIRLLMKMFDDFPAGCFKIVSGEPLIPRPEISFGLKAMNAFQIQMAHMKREEDMLTDIPSERDLFCTSSLSHRSSLRRRSIKEGARLLTFAPPMVLLLLTPALGLLTRVGGGNTFPAVACEVFPSDGNIALDLGILERASEGYSDIKS